MAHSILQTSKKYYPSPSPFVDQVQITVVLVEGVIGDYAAYIGHGDDIKWIQAYGNKLSYQEAIGHFPDLDAKKYRK